MKESEHEEIVRRIRRRALLVLVVAIIASLIIGCFIGCNFCQQCQTKAQNTSEQNISVVPVPTTTVPTVKPTTAPVKPTPAAPTTTVVSTSTVTPAKEVCRVTDSLSVLLNKWSSLDVMSKKKIADQSLFFDNSDKVAEEEMRFKVAGHQNGDRELVSNLSGEFLQVTFSKDGVICNGRNIRVLYPEEVDPGIEVRVFVTDNPKGSEKIQFVFFYKNGDIVAAGWGKSLKFTFIPNSSNDGDSGSGGGGVSPGGGPVSPGAESGGSPAPVPA